MELKLIRDGIQLVDNILLIAPLMELKYINITCKTSRSCLLIAPLMELKFVDGNLKIDANASFNRTAYGIEITS